MKLKFRLSLIVSAILAVVVATVSVILLTSATRLQEEAVFQNMENLTGKYSMQLQVTYAQFMQTIQTLSEIMNSFETIPPDERRGRYDNMIESLLGTSPNYTGMFTLWKPDVLDGLDGEFAGTEGTDSTGRYMSWFTRQNGSISKLALTEYEYYQDVYRNIEKKEPLVSNPYYSNINGKKTLTTRLSCPIIAGDTIVGMIGLMLDLGPAQALILSIKPYGTGRALLLANDGTIIAHYDAGMIGKKLRDPDQIKALGDKAASNVEAGLRTGQPVSAAYKDRVFESYPFYPGESSTAWTILSSVSQKDVLATVNQLTTITIVIIIAAVILSAVIIFFVSGKIAGPIVSVALTLKDISEGEGDLTRQVNINSNDEIGDLARYFNQTLEKIRNLIITIKGQSVKLFDIGNDLALNMVETASSVNQITANIRSIKTRVVNQSASVTETNATMEQITGNINKLNENVESQTLSVAQSSSAIEEMLANIESVTHTLVQNARNVKELSGASEVGRRSLQEVATNIQGIARESEGLLEINSVMENIASQTNLLSMNAAIEAAHAGEAGKGFAVVADEIRKLAESSSEQSKTISSVLKKIKESIDKIGHSTNNVLTNFEAIDHSVKIVSDQEGQIRNAMEEQNEGSKQVLQSIALLNDLTEQVKGGAAEMREGSREVIHESKNLEKVTQEITSGMNEMTSGADEINSAITSVNRISVENKENIEILVNEVSRFKIE
ncbi:methyl-accepting chemotaxis protein [Spirochaetia bacterium]|nr:methyl-accepting chemotaxis protein [Spirochaetia bacterium]